MYRRLTNIAVVTLTLALGCAVSFGFTFSVDGGCAGSVPAPYSDGTLIGYPYPNPLYSTDVLSALPVDALHIGAPLNNVIRMTDRGLVVVSPIFFSIDHGDPYPIQGVGIGPDSAEEILVSNKWASGQPDGTHGTATCGELTGGTGGPPAIESNLGLGAAGVAHDDDVDALDLNNVNPGTDLIFFSIDDLVPLVPNGTSAWQTEDIFVRLPASGGMVKVIDGIDDVGLYRDDEGACIEVFNDDIDALIIVEVDDDPDNNVYVEIEDPQTHQIYMINLGDGILFSVDRDLPDPDGGGPRAPYNPSLDPTDVYFSALDGTAPVLVIDGEEAFLASSGPLMLSEEYDLDALGAFGETVPEPATMLLVGTGLIGIVGMLRRRRLTD